MGIFGSEDVTMRMPVLKSKVFQAAYVTLQYPNARKSLLGMGKTEKELDVMPAAQIVLLNGILRFKNLAMRRLFGFHCPMPKPRKECS